jgi:hypothetical protein
VSDCEYGDAVLMANENDVVRKVSDWELADRGVLNARHESSAARKLFQKIERF